jgi:hypothetical protein
VAPQQNRQALGRSPEFLTQTLAPPTRAFPREALFRSATYPTCGSRVFCSVPTLDSRTLRPVYRSHRRNRHAQMHLGHLCRARSRMGSSHQCGVPIDGTERAARYLRQDGQEPTGPDRGGAEIRVDQVPRTRCRQVTLQRSGEG